MDNLHCQTCTKHTSKLLQNAFVPNVSGFGFASRTYSLSSVSLVFLVAVFFWFVLVLLFGLWLTFVLKESWSERDLAKWSCKATAFSTDLDWIHINKKRNRLYDFQSSNYKNIKVFLLACNNSCLLSPFQDQEIKKMFGVYPQPPACDVPWRCSGCPCSWVQNLKVSYVTSYCSDVNTQSLTVLASHMIELRCKKRIIMFINDWLYAN